MASVPADPRFIGTWDLTAGAMHSELILAADGSYVHGLWANYRHHWGNWAVEVQNGTPFLALHLTGAVPLTEPGPMGMQPVQWPAWEAWQIVSVGDQQITLLDCRLVRVPPEVLGPPAVAYPPAPPFTPPGMGSQEVPQQAMALAAGPTPTAGAMMPASPPVPPIIQQWQDQHAMFDVIRATAAQINASHMDTTRQIGDLYAKQNAANLASQLANTQAMSDVVHAGAKAFTASLSR